LLLGNLTKHFDLPIPNDDWGRPIETNDDSEEKTRNGTSPGDFAFKSIAFAANASGIFVSTMAVVIYFLVAIFLL
jgi:hypothetical protein